MKKLGLISALLVLSTPSMSDAQTSSAVHVSSEELEATIERAPEGRVSDQQIRMIDVGGMNLGVGVVHRPPTSTLSAIQHHKQAEIYRVVSGRGILVTSRTLTNGRELDPGGWDGSQAHRPERIGHDRGWYESSDRPG